MIRITHNLAIIILHEFMDKKKVVLKNWEENIVESQVIA